MVLVISHFGFEGETLVLIALVPGHCLSFTYFLLNFFGLMVKYDDELS